jgi:hypothetical protein
VGGGRRGPGRRGSRTTALLPYPERRPRCTPIADIAVSGHLT